MSFILDALRKSENERQKQGSTEFAGVPVGRDERSTPRWLWIVGLLLAINLAVLTGLLMRPDVTPTSPSVQLTESVPQPAADEPPSFVDRVAAAKANVPAAQASPEPVAESPASPATQPVIITQNPASLDTSQVYPTFQEVVVAGDVTLPTLAIDIHVFSEAANDRFVFINMSKYQEGARLEEGPLLREITADGVVLEYDGVTFLLPRE